MYISVTKDRENRYATFFEPVKVTSLEQLLEIAKKHGYSPSIFKGNYRKGENVVATECLFCDIDNTKEEPCSLERFKEEWKDYKYIILTSRNHQKAKDKKTDKEREKYGSDPWPAADRFHVLFPLGYSEKSFDRVKAALVGMTSKFQYFDKAVSDPCRQFFGAENTQLFFNDGKCVKIDDFIDEQPHKILSSDDCPDYLKIVGHEVPYVQESDHASILPDKRIELLNGLDIAKASGIFDDYPEWMRLGAGLKSEGYSFEDWLNLSDPQQRSGKLLAEAKRSWESFNGKVTGGTLTEYVRRVDPDFMTRSGAMKKIAAASEQNRQTVNAQVKEKIKPRIESVDEKTADDNVTKEVSENAPELHLPMPYEKWDMSPGHCKVDQKGNIKPQPTIQNLKRMLDFYGIEIKENLMTHKIDVVFKGKTVTEGKHENYMLGLMENMSVVNGLMIGKDRMSSFITAIGHENAYHPVRDYLAKLKWDGVDRFDYVLNSLPTKASYPEDMKRVLVKSWFVSCVSAVMEEQYRGRGVLVLQGPQSIGKTSWFKNFVPNVRWFEEGLSLDPSNKDSIELAMSCWIGELGELEGIFKRSDNASLKAFLTKQVDNIRFAYERRSESYQRRTVFCGSVNQQVFLTDPTGASRFWTIPVVSKLSPGPVVDINQWWAQVLAWYMAGEKWWLDPETECRLEHINSEHSESDPFEELLHSHYDFNAKLVRVMTATEVLIEIGYGKTTKGDVNRMADALRKRTRTGFKRNKVKGFLMPDQLTGPDYTPEESTRKEMVVDHVNKELGDDVPW